MDIIAIVFLKFFVEGYVTMFIYVTAVLKIACFKVWLIFAFI